MNLSNYLVNASTVCQWDRENQLIADNLNRIYHALDMRLNPILIMGEEPRWNPNLYSEIMDHVRDNWMCKKDVLLKLTDEQIEEYVRSQAEIYHIPPVPPHAVDNVEILRAS